MRDGVAGVPRLVYADLDDGFIPQAPWWDWKSESGAPWPYADEMRVAAPLNMRAITYLAVGDVWRG